MTRWRELLLLVGIGLLVHGPLLRPGHAPVSPHDFVPYGWPLKQVLYDSLQAGRGPPLWRSDQLSGSVALTQPQALYTHPFELLYWIVPPLWAVGPTLWMHLLLAGLGCAVLGRQLGLRAAGRAVMGVAGLVSFKLLLVVYAGWMPVLPSLALLPWLAAALIGFTRSPDTARVLLLAGAVALTLLAGTLQYAYYLAIFFTPFLLWKVLHLARREGSRPASRLVLSGLFAASLGFAIAAHLWLPILADLPLLTRGATPSYDFFRANHALHPIHLTTLLAPEALGRPQLRAFWEEVMYVGWLPLGLAALSVVTCWRTAAVPWLASAALASAGLAFDTPLLRWMYDWFPGYASFRSPPRTLFITSYAVIALAGHGADWLAAHLRRRSRRAAVLTVAALLAFMTGEGFWRARQYLEMRPHAELEPALPVVEELADDGPYRLARVSMLPPLLAWGQSAGLEFVGGYDPYAFAHYRRYLELLGWLQLPSPASQAFLLHVRRTDMLDALNVRYVVSDRRGPARADGWMEVASWERHPTYQFGIGRRDRELRLYERTEPLERAFLVERVVTVPDPELAERAIEREDLRTVAVVETPADEELRIDVSPGDALEVIHAKPGRLAFRSHTAGTRFAVVSEVWHPGWSAVVDDTPASLYRTDGALLGLWIPPGRHEIVLDFTPPRLRLGLVLGGAGLALGTWIAVPTWQRGHRRG